MERQIRCEDCTAEHTVKRKDARYCPTCRLLRLLTWAAKKIRGKRTCRLCRAPYLPHISPDHSKLCGDCLARVSDGPEVECALCRERRAGHHKDIRICVACLRDPDQRKLVLNALRKKQRKNKETSCPAS